MNVRWVLCWAAATMWVGAAAGGEIPKVEKPFVEAAVRPAPSSAQSPKAENPGSAPGPVQSPKTESPKAAQPPEMNISVDSPTQVIQKYTEELRSIVEPEKSQEKGKKDQTREKEISDKVRQFFDFESLARLAMGRHWSRITEAQRKEYQTLFVSLIEDSYLRKSKDIVGKYQIVYGREEVQGNHAKVSSRVVRNDADVEIVYELHRNPKNWMIFNIVLDGVDLIRNYQTQFNSIIMKSGFDSLLSRLRKKKEEIGTEVNL